MTLESRMITYGDIQPRATTTSASSSSLSSTPASPLPSHRLHARPDDFGLTLISRMPSEMSNMNDFCEQIVQRDGTDVVVGSAQACHAAHLMNKFNPDWVNHLLPLLSVDAWLTFEDSSSTMLHKCGVLRVVKIGMIGVEFHLPLIRNLVCSCHRQYTPCLITQGWALFEYVVMLIDKKPLIDIFTQLRCLTSGCSRLTSPWNIHPLLLVCRHSLLDERCHNVVVS